MVFGDQDSLHQWGNLTCAIIVAAATNMVWFSRDISPTSRENLAVSTNFAMRQVWHDTVTRKHSTLLG